MAKTKEQKQGEIKTIRENLAKQKAIYFVDFKGLKADELNTLKRELNRIEAKLMVVKKTLARIALKQEGVEYNTKELKGEVAFVFSFGDQFAPTKQIVNLSKASKNFQVLGGCFMDEGKYHFISAQEVMAYAAIPGRQELYAQFAYALNDAAASFARVINAIKEKAEKQTVA